MPLFLITSQGSGSPLFRVPRGGRTRFEDIESLSSYLVRGPEMCHCGNTKRGKRVCAFPLQGIVHLEISQVSHDDRFAALQIVFVDPLWVRSRGTRDPTIAYDCGGSLPAYGPVTGLSRFLSFSVFGLKIT